MTTSMNAVDYCRWKYRDPQTGTVRRTERQMTAAEAATLQDAEPIAGTLTRRRASAHREQGASTRLPDRGAEQSSAGDRGSSDGRHAGTGPGAPPSFAGGAG